MNKAKSESYMSFLLLFKENCPIVVDFCPTYWGCSPPCHPFSYAYGEDAANSRIPSNFVRRPGIHAGFLLLSSESYAFSGFSHEATFQRMGEGATRRMGVAVIPKCKESACQKNKVIWGLRSRIVLSPRPIHSLQCNRCHT